MRKVCIILFLSTLFTNLTFSQTEKFDISFRPEIGVTYSLNYDMIQESYSFIEMILNPKDKNTAILFNDFEKNGYVRKTSLFIDLKLMHENLDTTYYQFTLRNALVSIVSKNSEPLNEELKYSIAEFSNFLNDDSEINFILKSYSENNKIKSEIITYSAEKLNDNKRKFYSNSQFEELKSIVIHTNYFLNSYSKNDISINDNWHKTDEINFSDDSKLDLKTTYTLKDVTEQYFIIESSSFLDESVKVNNTNNNYLRIVNSIYHIDKETGWILYRNHRYFFEYSFDSLLEMPEDEEGQNIFPGVRDKTVNEFKILNQGTINRQLTKK